MAGGHEADLADLFVVIRIGPVIIQDDHPSEVFPQPQDLLDEFDPGQYPWVVGFEQCFACFDHAAVACLHAAQPMRYP